MRSNTGSNGSRSLTRRGNRTWCHDGAGQIASIRRFAKEGFMWGQVKQALYQSTTRFVTRLAGLVPGFVALFLALLISLLLAWIVGMVVRRLLSSMRFDERVSRWGLP